MNIVSSIQNNRYISLFQLKFLDESINENIYINTFNNFNKAIDDARVNRVLM